jgi:hypothetical protein
MVHRCKNEICAESSLNFTQLGQKGPKSHKQTPNQCLRITTTLRHAERVERRRCRARRVKNLSIVHRSENEICAELSLKHTQLGQKDPKSHKQTPNRCLSITATRRHAERVEQRRCRARRAKNVSMVHPEAKMSFVQSRHSNTYNSARKAPNRTDRHPIDALESQLHCVMLIVLNKDDVVPGEQRT